MKRRRTSWRRLILSKSTSSIPPPLKCQQSEPQASTCAWTRSVARRGFSWWPGSWTTIPPCLPLCGRMVFFGEYFSLLVCKAFIIRISAGSGPLFTSPTCLPSIHLVRPLAHLVNGDAYNVKAFCRGNNLCCKHTRNFLPLHNLVRLEKRSLFVVYFIL